MARAADESGLVSWLRSHAVVIRGPRGMALDRWLVRHAGVSLVTWQYAIARDNPYQPTLLLITTGARSGLPRSVALPYVRDGDAYVVVASNGGGAKNPHWLVNLLAHPRGTVRVRRRDVPVEATVSRGDADRRLYDLVVAERPVVADYRAQTEANGRALPLVRLRPLDEVAP